MHIKGYFKKKWSGFRLILIPEADNPAFLRKCCLDDFKNGHDFKLVQSSRFAQVYRFAFNGRLYFLKKFISRDIFEPVKNLLRGDRAIRALKGDRFLLTNGFNAPKCMMAGKKGSNIFNVTEAIQGGKDLVMFFAEEFPEGEGMDRIKTREKRNLCKLLGKEIGKMHAKGIVHGDLRWGNVLIVKTPARETQIWFLDNERTFGYSSISRKMRIVNLVQMNMIPSSAVTLTDRMRFYKSYLAENPCLISQKKNLAQKVLHRTANRRTGNAGFPIA